MDKQKKRWLIFGGGAALLGAAYLATRKSAGAASNASLQQGSSSNPPSEEVHVSKDHGAKPSPPIPPECLPQTPPGSNPFFNDDYDVDYQKISDHFAAEAKVTMNERDATIASSMGAVAAAVAIFTPIGTVVAGVILAAAAVAVAVDRLYSHFKSNPNSPGEANSLLFWSREWIKRGWLPEKPTAVDSLKAIWENLHDGISAIEAPDREPYFVDLAHLSGDMFRKWGGHRAAQYLALFFVNDPLGAAIGTMPSGGDRSLSNNEPRLKLFAMLIALEYGVQCHVDEIYQAAQDAATNYVDILSFKPELADNSIGAVQLVFVFYSYICGVHAALTKAAQLAGKPVPAPITFDTAYRSLLDNMVVAPPPPPPPPTRKNVFAAVAHADSLISDWASLPQLR